MTSPYCSTAGKKGDIGRYLSRLGRYLKQGPRVDENQKPQLGMIFNTLEEKKSFYHEYAKLGGLIFIVVRQSLRMEH